MILGVNQSGFSQSICVSKFETDEGKNGTIDLVQVFETHYGTHGKKIYGIEKLDFQNDGNIDQVTYDSIIYDSVLQEIRRIVYEDNSNDGTINSITTSTNEYNHQGNLIKIKVDSDFGNDGSIDFSVTTLQEYDSLNRLILSKSETDVDGDQVADITTESELMYDLFGNVVMKTERHGGIIIATDNKTSSIYTYDNRGSIEKIESQIDDEINGTIDRFEFVLSSYNNNNDLVTRTKIDSSITGIKTSIDKLSNFYDNNEIITKSIRDVTFFNGSSGRKIVTCYEYSPSGELIGQTIEQSGFSSRITRVSGICLNQISPNASVTVPTSSSWGLIVLCLVLINIGVIGALNQKKGVKILSQR